MFRFAMSVIGLLAFASTAQACINTSATDHTGRKFSPAWYIGEELAESMTWQRADIEGRAATIIQTARVKPGYDSWTDLGALLVFQKQYAKAVRHFLMLEKRYPGQYKTAANLGTALELSGYDAPALAWIRIGIQRNRNAHDGTEWLHARILEAKLAQARDPNYLSTHSIAGLAFSSATVPPLPAMPRGNDGTQLAPWDVDQALSYQLHERVQFVPPKDPVVANLLQDWATLNLAGGPIENAEVLYALAQRYGAQRTPLMRKRETFIEDTLDRVGRDEADSSDTACDICRPVNQ